MIYKKILTTFIFVLMLSSCSENNLQPLASDATILAFGDSLTFGVGVKPEHSYPSQLSELTHLQVINAGISGEITADGLPRLKKILQTTSPYLIILLEGGNDILRNHSLEITKSNLAAMIELAKQDNIPIIIIGVPNKNIFSSTASFYIELAEQYQLILDDESISSLIKSPSMKSDSVHFNQKGYRKLAENIHQIIVDNGGL